MTKYTLTMTFGTEATKEEVEGWAGELLVHGPEGAELTIHREPLVLNASDLTSEFVGHTVSFLTNDHWRVIGELEAVHRLGGKTEDSVALVVDNKAWALNYGVVEVTDW